MDEFLVKPSKRLDDCLMAVHVLSACARLANALPIMVQGLLILAVVAHYRWLQQCRPVCPRFRFTDAQGWEMAGSGQFVAVHIMPGTVVSTFALFLHVEIHEDRTHISPSSTFFDGRPPKKLAFLLLPDSFAPDRYRAFIVKLKTTYKIKSNSANLLVKSM